MYETGPSYRVGALILGIKNYRFGANSEHVRHAIQDRVIHGMIGNAGFRNVL
jgi:Bacterial toxin 23